MPSSLSAVNSVMSFLKTLPSLLLPGVGSGPRLMGLNLHHLLCSSRATADPSSRRCSACSSGSPAPDEDQHSEEAVQVIAGSSPRSHNPLSQRNVNNGRFSTRLLYFMTVRCKHVFKNDSSNNFRNRCYRSFVLLSGLRLLSLLVETFYPPV